MTKLQEMGKLAKIASADLALAGSAKTTALIAAANALIENTADILSANQKDIEKAEENGLTAAMIDRLRLTEERIEGMAKGMSDVANENDPVGRVLAGTVHPKGIKIEKVTVPLGVIGIIFESRPNVTSDAAALCIKAGNAVILRGGKEAYHSNRMITDILDKAFTASGLPKNSVQLVDDTSRASAQEMMNLTEYLDVLIPRGGAGLIQAVKQNSKVPVIETGVGIVHIYVDESADIDMASNIIFNAKTTRPSVCNAAETLLVHQSLAEKALPIIKAKLDEKQVELRCDERARAILPDTTAAVQEDWETEYLDYILSVKVVDSFEEALAHIARYSSGHSEAIVTESFTRAEEFLNRVDSSAVYVNASTRFTDGGEFGLGAEIGISTQKLHARGPMGLEQLTSQKYLIRGNGQVR
ncbi:glutamate-5-semialdehyde dehydrogenase [Scatolibacter rhodanostii]|uniref:glutamate-5-semialdehyde dehydrogenase n=1 Tax=Scatolibacter rhodanostii TaxID=2014781 RepID=UPI000C07BAE9|nr:glutamate-5-semialdehyde dehydrogenase [Scatolibacter rhodanostii]